MSHHKFLFSLLLVIFAIKASADTGPATYYNPPYTPSACNGYQNDGVLIAGASSKFWNNRGACGSYYRVRCLGSTNDFPNPCTGAEVTVKIVDYCPPPFCNGDINLSRDAFQIISQLKAGRIWVSYDRI
ncbi:hypothetical protein KFK09_006454 [Dendrobium nobile]|uniref:Expansin-like EG45 domain-containing protein n=1 Tax=Dendrobium nobile TaxID=94219 RepID=A0A8T3BP52_DENNO|nr:hypothetical protein KFK09_006454 [Dendrobium nobile]